MLIIMIIRVLFHHVKSVLIANKNHMIIVFNFCMLIMRHYTKFKGEHTFINDWDFNVIDFLETLAAVIAYFLGLSVYTHICDII